MTQPLIDILPASYASKAGWPWTEASAPLPGKMPDGSNWPRISIVTPSYNQGEFIEETIRSVLLQGYPNLEYIIIDGGSTDNSVEIIKKYKPWLTYWVSEKDRGQSHAINKGFEHATGEIYAWLNSDDYYLPVALKAFAQAYGTDKRSVAWAGSALEINKEGEKIGEFEPRIDGDLAFFSDWWISSRIRQPACAFPAALFNAVEGVDENLHYAMDFDLWLKLRKLGQFIPINEKIACVRLYPEIKTRSNIEMRDAEVIHVCLKHGMRQSAENKIRLHAKRKTDSCERIISSMRVGSGMSYFSLLRYFIKRTLLAPFRIIKNLWSSVG
jgi:glycosyltransferase involved in cell wall biosynthesis